MTKREEISLATPGMPVPDRLVVYLQLPGANSLEVLAEGKPGAGIGFTPMDILLVDDNPGDVHMVFEALKKAVPAARRSVAIAGIRQSGCHLRRAGCVKSP